MVVDKNILFSGSDDLHICLWNLHTYTHISSIEAHEDPIRDLLII